MIWWKTAPGARDLRSPSLHAMLIAWVNEDFILIPDDTNLLLRFGLTGRDAQSVQLI